LTAIIPALQRGGLDRRHDLFPAAADPGADEIIAIDDCSTDATAEVAEALGVEVLRPPQNTGLKAGAQSFALEQVETEMVMAIDADTTLTAGARCRTFCPSVEVFQTLE
jgi:biofilm PGA synthesis N-glycosyltransferase PgaC